MFSTSVLTFSFAFFLGKISSTQVAKEQNHHTVLFTKLRVSVIHLQSSLVIHPPSFPQTNRLFTFPTHRLLLSKSQTPYHFVQNISLCMSVIQGSLNKTSTSLSNLKTIILPHHQNVQCPNFPKWLIIALLKLI